LIARIHEEVQANITAYLATTDRGTIAKFKGWLRKIPPDVAALIAVRECLHKLSDERETRAVTLQRLAGEVGKLFEMEVRIREAQFVNPVYMQKIHEQVKENGTRNKDHLRKVYNVAYQRIMKGELDSGLTQAEQITLGKIGIQACLDAGMIEVHRTFGERGRLVFFELVPEVREFLLGYTDADVRSIVDREAGAMLCPPDPWVNLQTGGYLTPRRRAAFPLMNVMGIRKSERARIRKEFTAENMPMVFAVGNYLQSQAFTVHQPTLNAVRRLWESGGGTLGVPNKNPPEKPVCPFPPTWVKEEAPVEEQRVFKEWKISIAPWHKSLRTWKGRVREIGGFLKVASKQEGPIWFPVYMDKRGRWYYAGSPNPQGSDLSKAVLHSYIKKPLGKEGVYWLKVHIANSYGFDKERFDDRARWTEQNWESIKRALDEPENHPEVWGTDAPWCMFSAAYELNQAYLSGNPETYETGLIVHMDATCSGLQHFSALLRDPMGATYVNLDDEAKCGPKQDIYSKVSAMSLQAIAKDAEGSGEEADMAKWWLSIGIPRGLAKKPVMTYVYGATVRGTAQFIEEYVYKEMPDAEFPDPLRSYTYCAYAAKKLFVGIAGTVPAADNAMRWLRSVAKGMPKGKRMEWRTPTGFLVQHDYQDYDERILHVHSCGLKQITVREWNEGTKPLQMQNALSPNFVHALDASHLTMTAARMQEAGLFMVGIHDSFGTHAGDVSVMHDIIRETFVTLYSSRNILGEFLWEVGGIGEPPMRGSFDLKNVLESEFFFC
jgi:DNA-directed RNA polymerase